MHPFSKSSLEDLLKFFQRHFVKKFGKSACFFWKRNLLKIFLRSFEKLAPGNLLHLLYKLRLLAMCNRCCNVIVAWCLGLMSCGETSHKPPPQNVAVGSLAGWYLISVCRCDFVLMKNLQSVKQYLGIPVCGVFLFTQTLCKYWLASRSSLKILSPKFLKCCLGVEDRGQHFTNWKDKICNDDQCTSHYLFCYISKANNSTSQQVNSCEKAVTTLMLPGQQFTGNIAWMTFHIC